jgi:hypothetical protein
VRRAELCGNWKSGRVNSVKIPRRGQGQVCDNQWFECEYFLSSHYRILMCKVNPTELQRIKCGCSLSVDLLRHICEPDDKWDTHLMNIRTHESELHELYTISYSSSVSAMWYSSGIKATCHREGTYNVNNDNI